MLCIYGGKSDSTNNMESPPVVLETPHAVQARGAECRRNSLPAPSGMDLPTMCSCAENCHF